MKNPRIYLLFLLFTVLFSASGLESFAAAPAAKTEINQGGKRKKNGQYKKKNGFFKRLFKGKNACDCPKHK